MLLFSYLLLLVVLIRINSMNVIKRYSENFYILGSGSFSRKLILKSNNINFEVLKADIDEYSIGDRSIGTDEKTSELVLLLANSKADAIIKNGIPDKLYGQLLLTCDQVVTHQNKILEKPKDINEARKFIQSYSNSFCSTIGSLILTDTISNKRRHCIDKATIYFNTIPNDIIEKILDEKICLQCAGGLMVEHPLIQPYIKCIDGTQEALMGLSTISLKLLTKQFMDDI